MTDTTAFDALPSNERNAIDHWIRKNYEEADLANHLTGAAPIRSDISKPEVMANLREGHANNFNNPDKSNIKETIMGEYEAHLAQIAQQQDSTKIEGLGFGSQGVAPEKESGINR